MEQVCKRLDDDSQLITLFAENYTPINCRSSLEGVFHFDYQVHMYFYLTYDLNCGVLVENDHVSTNFIPDAKLYIPSTVVPRPTLSLCPEKTYHRSK